MLKFLNIDQALADVAYFVEEMKKTIPDASNSRVIMAGGSYSATMVAWFRQKYPHLIDGGWASSAPLLAKLDFVGKYGELNHLLREKLSQYQNFLGSNILTINNCTGEVIL